MRVEILVDDERLGLKKGDVYEAQPYVLDPSEKLTLSDVNTGKAKCNVYREDRGVKWRKEQPVGAISTERDAR